MRFTRKRYSLFLLIFQNVTAMAATSTRTTDRPSAATVARANCPDQAGSTCFASASRDGVISQ